jgi:hypothetical protein
MRLRASENPVDKVAGLAFLLEVPIYLPDEDVECAWERLLNVISTEQRGILFFLYPAPGDGPRLCTPTWNQILNGSTFLPRNDASLGPWVRVSLGQDGLSYMRGPFFRDATLSGFQTPSADRQARKGRVNIRVIRDNCVQVHTFDMFTPVWHQQPIPEESSYFIVASRNFQHWLIGTRLEGDEDVIQRVSVLQSTTFDHRSKEEEDRIIYFRNLAEYGLIKFC